MDLFEFVHPSAVPVPRRRLRGSRVDASGRKGVSWDLVLAKPADSQATVMLRRLVADRHLHDVRRLDEGDLRLPLNVAPAQPTTTLPPSPRVLTRGRPNSLGKH